MALKLVRVEGTEAPKLADALIRFEQNVDTALKEVAAGAPPSVIVVIADPTTKLYVVQSTDRYIIVNARGGPMKLALPVPGGVSQALTVRKAYATSNTVSVSRVDAKPFGDGAQSVGVSLSDDFISDGANWWSL